MHVEMFKTGLQVSTGCLTTQVEEAIYDIVRLIQRQSFYDVLRSLGNSEAFLNISKKGSNLGKYAVSSLRKLQPILVHGIMRVGGRLQYSTLLQELKHSLILLKRHHITQLVVQYFHIIAIAVAPYMLFLPLEKNFGLCMDILLCAIISGSVNNIICGRHVLVNN